MASYFLSISAFSLRCLFFFEHRIGLLVLLELRESRPCQRASHERCRHQNSHADTHIRLAVLCRPLAALPGHHWLKRAAGIVVRPPGMRRPVASQGIAGKRRNFVLGNSPACNVNDRHGRFKKNDVACHARSACPRVRRAAPRLDARGGARAVRAAVHRADVPRRAACTASISTRTKCRSRPCCRSRPAAARRIAPIARRARTTTPASRPKS